ncbi:MAG: hypothetical protein IJ571_02445 [Ruminococcus sp.]|nr:hypothetical protein [Ruminococcus sp.]
MRYSKGVAKYSEQKKQNILNAVIGAENVSSPADNREDITMTTNVIETSGRARVKSRAGGFIAAACAALVIGGGAAAYFSMKAPETTPKAASAAPAASSSQADEVSQPQLEEPVISDPDTPTIYATSPDVVIAPDDAGTVEDGFEGFDIKVSYLVKDLWKGVANYAQHSYGVVIDVSTKEGYELPWSGEESAPNMHFGELWLNTDHSEFFRLMDTDAVLSYGFKTVNNDGEDVFRFVIAAEVADDFDLDSSTEVMFGISGIYWGDSRATGGIEKSEGKFIAAETFDDMRTIDEELIIPYAMETEPIDVISVPETDASSEAEPETTVFDDSQNTTQELSEKAITLNVDDHGRITEGFEGLDIRISELWYVPATLEYGVAIEVKSADGTPLYWDLYSGIDVIYNDLTPFMETTDAENLHISGGWEKEGEPGTFRFLVYSEPKADTKVDENAEISFGLNTITVGGEVVASGNFEANFHFNTNDVADVQAMQ